ncbi:MAG: ribose 5-phosphate isomerase B [Anaerorhabdus sp.]
MKIGIGNDHTAIELKKELVAYLEAQGHTLIDYGTNALESFNYAFAGERVSIGVVQHEVDCGIALCGTGIGISIACNKINGIRACVCSEPYSAKLSKQHNNTNILCFGARVVGTELAKMIVDEWLGATYEGGRHEERVATIMSFEKK